MNPGAWAGLFTAGAALVTAVTTGIVALVKAVQAGRKADAHAAAAHGQAHPYPPAES